MPCFNKRCGYALYSRETMNEFRFDPNTIKSEYSFLKQRIEEYIKYRGGVLPEMFNPYNKQEITDIAPTITTSCDRSCSSATVCICVKI